MTWVVDSCATLSILVPTYARAASLAALLRALGGDPDVLAARIPVLVSDNASPDGTADVVRALQAEMPELDLRLHVQERNIGAERNYAWLVEHAPQTDYVWIVGDDDVPGVGAVGEVLGLLAALRPALLHLPHTFERDGHVYTRSPCPPAVESLGSSRELMLAYTRWPSFISSCVVERAAMARAIREVPTQSRFAPYIWFMSAARDRPVAVAARALVAGGTEATWSDVRAEILTEGTIGAFDEGLHRVLGEEEFGQVLDGFYANGDCFDCWQARPLESLMAAGRRFPASRQLRHFLWLLARAHGRADALAALDASARAAGAAQAAQLLLAEGEERFAAGDAGSAVQRFQAAIDELPTWPTAWNNLGVALHAQARAEADEAFAVALDLDPDHADALLNRALCHLASGRAPAAAAAARRLLALEPAHAEAERILEAAAAD